MLGVKPRGLERFENRFGEPLPSPLPKAAALEWRAAEQRTADRKVRQTTLAAKPLGSAFSLVFRDLLVHIHVESNR